MAVLILSSSRGGSTIFTEFLRRHPGLRHLPGEINPLLRLAGFTDTGSDAMTAAQAESPAALRLRVLMEEQVGRYGPVSPGQMVADVRERLRWQWPHLAVAEEQVEAAVAAAWSLRDDSEAFTAAILKNIQQKVPIHAGLYDLPQQGPLPAPPHHDILEEPPFILFAPWQRRGEGPLIIKTPSNAYRLPFFHRFFEGTKILHLTRNPAAAINGLMDGWLYHGFHSHPLPYLEIAGYSERVEGGHHWWKFDRPPGWEDFVRGHRLAEVCAFQWSSAHRAVLEWGVQKDTWLTVRFEDFLRDPLVVMGRVCAWLEVPVAPELQQVLQTGLAPRMATARPRQRRWFDRHQELEPVLSQRNIMELASELGYENREDWL